jgi:hypothetical protein
MIVLSGVGPGYTGVGHLIAHLLRTKRPGDRIFWHQEKSSPPRLLLQRRQFISLTVECGRRVWSRIRWSANKRRLASYEGHLVLIHPQTLGCGFTLDLMKRRTSTDLYVMDNAGFCRSSYNHREGATCTACLGTDGAPGREKACPVFPERDPAADRLVRELPELSRDGRVRFLVQNLKQAELLRRHCGSSARIACVGLWADDWDESAGGQDLPSSEVVDVVFHGNDVAAKGSRWSIELARRMPKRRFFFPFPVPDGILPPANAIFEPCNWSTGLRARVHSAAITLVPSLWSATIEGALVKSLVQARGVAVVEQPGSYAQELPPGTCLVLQHDLGAAAETLEKALASRWEPDRGFLREWFDRLKGDRPLIERLRKPIWLDREPITSVGHTVLGADA